MLNAQTHPRKIVEWDAEAYHRLSDMQFEIAMAFLSALTDALVLDAGCGSGRITRELLKRLPRGGVLGVDLAHGMVAMAQTWQQPRGQGDGLLFSLARQRMPSDEPRNFHT